MVILFRYTKLLNKNILFCFLVQIIGFCPVLSGQSDLAEDLYLYDDLWLSSRSAAMGGAILPLAEDTDAPIHNPAHIGGRFTDKKDRFLKSLYFPYFAGALNGNSYAVKNAIFSNKNSTYKKEVISGIGDKRQYGNYSIVPSLTFGRIFLGYSYNTQAAAKNTVGETSSILFRQREESGPGIGFSGKDSKGRLFIGIFVASIHRKESSGTFSYEDLETSQKRNKSLLPNSKEWSGMDSNIGLTWVAQKKYNLAFSLVANNPGTSKYKPSSEGYKEIYKPDNVGLGFGASPRLGSFGQLNYVLQFNHLTQNKVSVADKIATGLELQFGFTKRAKKDFAIRLGYNKVGLSYGVKMGLGLLSFEYTDSRSNIGSSNQVIEENRKIGIITINVADY